MSLANAIKQITMNLNEAEHPVAVMFGTVTKEQPLEILVDQRLLLDEDFFVLTEQLTRYEIDLKHSHHINGGSTQDALTEKIVIREGLKAGDGVLLLRMQGGQQYVVLDKVVRS
ncbi:MULTISPECIES: DUF2577 domain-containing protein [Paenibacillus]|uniref:DUF2577 domain-containing protein n=1 Tax=Paenibacillus TaxID=44249 RepID=UPI0006D81667|nr:DUF2577 domain-containing protein [Paenibacillus ihumii]